MIAIVAKRWRYYSEAIMAPLRPLSSCRIEATVELAELVILASSGPLHDQSLVDLIEWIIKSWQPRPL